MGPVKRCIGFSPSLQCGTFFFIFVTQFMRLFIKLQASAYALVALLLLLLLGQSSLCYAVSSVTLEEQQIQLLEKQATELSARLKQLQTEDVRGQADVEQDNHVLLMMRDDLARSLNVAKSNLAILRLQLQQLNKKINSATTIADGRLKKRLNFLSLLIEKREKEVDQLNLNTSLCESLLHLNNLKLRALAVQQKREKRKAEVQQLQMKVAELRAENEKIIASLAEGVDTERPPVLVQAEKTLAKLDIELNHIDIERLQLTIHFYYREGDVEHVSSLDARIVSMQQMLLRTQQAKNLLEQLEKTVQSQLSFWAEPSQQAAFKRTTLRHLETALKARASRIKVDKEQIVAIEQKVDAALSRFQTEKNKLINVRQGTFSESFAHWHKLSSALLQLPSLTSIYFYSLFSRFKDFVVPLPWYSQLGLVGLVLTIISIWVGGRRKFDEIVEQDKRAPFGEDVFHILTRLLKRNFGSVCFAVVLLVLFNVAQLPLASYKLVLMIFAVWFSFRAIIGLTRLALLETLSDVAGLDVHLYHRLRWTFVIGGIVTLGTVLSHHLNVHYLVRDLFDRLFMVFLFTVSLVLLRGRRVIVLLSQNYLNLKRYYTKRVIDLITILVPLVLLFNGAVGLFGYVNLAWAMSYYQAIIVLAVIVYVILKGILIDALELLSERMILQLENGWLLREAFVKPIHRIFQYMVIVLLTVVTFRLYGWDSDSSVAKFIFNLWHLNLLTLSSANITVKSLIEFLLLVALLVWCGRWTHEFCYRWLYQRVEDQGLRHSLSAFSQYTVIMVGAIITLSVLGVDFSGISMILGGLAVGMGFGLRDFANNIMGGIMLLLERPVKEGDLISVDNIEGQVTHIGIRSMRIKSWDNFEITIPNADTFSKPFTNWTHKDWIVRTVVPIKVSREDSPVKIQQLILDVLHIIPEVLDDPEPQAFLKHIDDALLEFEARYYINVEHHSRVQVRSIVLFAIMAQFNAANIKAPIPPIAIEKGAIKCKS